jgi:hypothetical protein
MVNGREKMFWKKKSEGGNLPGPKDIPELVGRHLVVALKQDPDWVWRLKGVVRPHPENKDVNDVRVFDEAGVAKNSFKIKDYDSFNQFPEAVLFEGWFNKKTLQADIKDNRVKEAGSKQ